VLGAARCAAFVIEACLREGTLLFCDPLLQSEVRRDDERGHGRLPSAGAFTRDSTLFLAGALSSSGLDEPAPRDIEALEPSRVVSMKQVANVRAVLVRDDAPAVDLLPSSRTSHFWRHRSCWLFALPQQLNYSCVALRRPRAPRSGVE